MDFNELHLHCMNNGIDYETTMSRHTIFDPWRNINDVKYFPTIRFHNWKTNRHIEISEPTWEQTMERIEHSMVRIIGELGLEAI